MKSPSQIDFAVEISFFDVTAEVIDVWELEAVLDGHVVELPEVSARPFSVVSLCL